MSKYPPCGPPADHARCKRFPCIQHDEERAVKYICDHATDPGCPSKRCLHHRPHDTIWACDAVEECRKKRRPWRGWAKVRCIPVKEPALAPHLPAAEGPR